MTITHDWEGSDWDSYHRREKKKKDPTWDDDEHTGKTIVED